MINVNLLPPAIKDEITQAKRNRLINSLLIKIFLLLVLILFLTIGVWFYYNNEVNIASAQLKEKEQIINKYGPIEEKSKRISDQLATIKKIKSSEYKWSSIIDELAKIVPDGVYITTLKADTKDQSRGTVGGVAKSKKEVAIFRDSMEKNGIFTYVDIEVSNTAGVEDFTFTFTLKPKKGN